MSTSTHHEGIQGAGTASCLAFAKYKVPLQQHTPTAKAPGRDSADKKAPIFLDLDPVIETIPTPVSVYLTAPPSVLTSEQLE